jgi:hypothetical protein
MATIPPEESLGPQRIRWKLIGNVVTRVSETNEKLSGETAA